MRSGIHLAALVVLTLSRPALADDDTPLIGEVQRAVLHLGDADLRVMMTAALQVAKKPDGTLNPRATGMLGHLLQHVPGETQKEMGPQIEFLGASDRGAAMEDAAEGVLKAIDRADWYDNNYQNAGYRERSQDREAMRGLVRRTIGKPIGDVRATIQMLTATLAVQDSHGPTIGSWPRFEHNRAIRQALGRFERAATVKFPARARTGGR